MNYIVFDIETKNFFTDVGKNDPALLDIALVCAYDSQTDEYLSFLEEELPGLWPRIERTDMLIGYNSDHFDIPLLNKYYPGDLTHIKSLDLMVEIQKAMGRRLKLNNVTQASFGEGKNDDPTQVMRLWKEGDIERVRRYCMQDVKITKELYEYMRDNKKVLYRDGPNTHEATIDTSQWNTKKESGMTHTLPF